MAGCVISCVKPFGSTVREKGSYSMIYHTVVCATLQVRHHCELVLGLNKQSKYKIIT